MKALVFSVDTYKDLLPYQLKSLSNKSFIDCVYYLSDLIEHEEAIKIPLESDFSSSLIKALSVIDSDRIFIVGVDHFFNEDLLHEDLLSIENTLSENSGLVGVRFNKHYSNKYVSWLYGISLQPAIIKRDHFLDLLRHGETPWQFEMFASYRGFKKGYRMCGFHKVWSYNISGVLNRGLILKHEAERYGILEPYLLNTTRGYIEERKTTVFAKFGRLKYLIFPVRPLLSFLVNDFLAFEDSKKRNDTD